MERGGKYQGKCLILFFMNQCRPLAVLVGEIKLFLMGIEPGIFVLTGRHTQHYAIATLAMGGAD